MARYGIVIDANRCTGCMTCVIACKQENLTRPGVWWNRVLALESEPLHRIIYFRVGCMHCSNPPCLKACPEHAIYMRPEGIILIDQEKCQGHGECIKACPYGMIDINPESVYFPGQVLSPESGAAPHRLQPPGKASMCTMCVHRIDAGREPACVEGCPSKAMVFGDLDDPGSPIHEKRRRSEPLLPYKATDPKTFYLFPAGASKEAQERVERLSEAKAP
ncbi:MAG: 4Fe-4S dicluster domain-containing protein [Deltaproteobacteria bacterium]|nr:4Fe-4S dicluster domain-containing protein [Deltaproteobacteria bacterium]